MKFERCTLGGRSCVNKLLIMPCFLGWISLYGGVPKMVGFPNKPIGFPTKNDHFGVFWGYRHFRKHLCILLTVR